MVRKWKRDEKSINKNKSERKRENSNVIRQSEEAFPDAVTRGSQGQFGN